MTTPAALIDNPVPYTPRPFGLLSVAALPALTERIQAGVSYQPDPCTEVQVSRDGCADDDLYDGIDPGAGVWGSDAGLDLGVTDCTWVTSSPFTVHGALAVPAFGGDPLARAERVLVNGEAHAVEEVFATGTSGSGMAGLVGVTPRLQAGADVFVVNSVLADAVLTIAGGIGMLEQSVGGTAYSGQLVLHLTAVQAVLAANAGLLVQSGTQLRTLTGSLVVVSGAYNGADPDGVVEVDGTSWVYATGSVAVLRSEVYPSTEDPSAQRNRSTNGLQAVVSRDYAIAIDGCAGVSAAHVGGYQADFLVEAP